MLGTAGWRHVCLGTRVSDLGQTTWQCPEPGPYFCFSSFFIIGLFILLGQILIIHLCGRQPAHGPWPGQGSWHSYLLCHSLKTADTIGNPLCDEEGGLLGTPSSYVGRSGLDMWAEDQVMNSSSSVHQDVWRCGYTGSLMKHLFWYILHISFLPFPTWCLLLRWPRARN